MFFTEPGTSELVVGDLSRHSGKTFFCLTGLSTSCFSDREWTLVILLTSRGFCRVHYCISWKLGFLV